MIEFPEVPEEHTWRVAGPGWFGLFADDYVEAGRSLRVSLLRKYLYTQERRFGRTKTRTEEIRVFSTLVEFDRPYKEMDLAEVEKRIGEVVAKEYAKHLNKREIEKKVLGDY